MSTSYIRFVAMIATSTLVMFGLMYLNTFAADHAWFSQTRMWMALYMGAAMAAVMLELHARYVHQQEQPTLRSWSER